jgi:hypothetical protein
MGTKEYNELWRKNNAERVKELNRIHRTILVEKRDKKRKEMVDYDNHEWFVVPDTDDKYLVNKNGVVINRKYRPLKAMTDKLGYVLIALNDKKHLLHRIMGKVFIPNPDNKPEINHKNGIKGDNRIENLEWVTRSENIQHSFDVLNKKSNFTGWIKKKKEKMGQV